jgi:hypothetical protein
MRRLTPTRLQPLLFLCCRFAPPAATRNARATGAVTGTAIGLQWGAATGNANASECWLLGMLVSCCCCGRFGRHGGVRRAVVAGLLQ